jgi:hypothetical protein
MTHQDLDAISSRHSFASSHPHGPLRERKEYLVEIGGTLAASRFRHGRQLLECALPAHAAVAEQHESIADSCRVADLMD